MHIRPVVRDDIPTLTTIFCEAYMTEGLFAFEAPYRDEYPLFWRYWVWQKQIVQLNCPGRYGFACVSDESDGLGEPGEILGAAWWFRRMPKNKDPSTDPYLQNNRSLASRVDHFLRTVEQVYWSWVRPNPIFSPSTYNSMKRVLYSSDLFETLNATTYWHLSWLAVAPQHQRKGVGNLLMDWGIEQSRKERALYPDQPPVPIGLHATTPGRGLYAKRGFKIIGWKPDLEEEWAKEMKISPRKELENVYARAMRPEIIHGGRCGMLLDETGFWTRDPEDTDPEEAVVMHGRKVDRVWTENALKLQQID